MPKNLMKHLRTMSFFPVSDVSHAQRESQVIHIGLK